MADNKDETLPPLPPTPENRVTLDTLRDTSARAVSQIALRKMLDHAAGLGVPFDDAQRMLIMALVESAVIAGWDMAVQTVADAEKINSVNETLNALAQQGNVTPEDIQNVSNAAAADATDETLNKYADSRQAFKKAVN